MGNSWGFIEPISHQSEYFWRRPRVEPFALSRLAVRKFLEPAFDDDARPPAGARTLLDV